MFIRPYFVIRNIFQNSKLNREKFVKDKKKYNVSKASAERSFNKVVTRNFHSKHYVAPLSFGGGGGGRGPRGDGPFAFIMFGSLLSAYVSSNVNKNRKK